MLISVEKNFIFIHVAKTGGQAMKQALRPYALAKARGQWRRLLSHLPVPEKMNAQFGPHASARWAKMKLPSAFFNGAFKCAVVRNPYDLAVSRYSFVQGSSDHHRHARAQKQSFLEFLRAEKRRVTFLHRDQTAMLYSFGGKLLVDRVYRFEQIDEAYQDIIKRLELTNMPDLRRKNQSKRGDYRSYYGDQERKLVEEIWARDLVNFGYEF